MRIIICTLQLIVSLPVHATELLYPHQVKQIFSEAPRLVVLWSVDCPPCYRELDMLKQLLTTNPQLPITLIATDDDSSRYPEVEGLYQTLEGEQLQKWVFSELAAPQLRFAIDNNWSGVLPRSYFIYSTEKRSGHSGILTAAQVMDWFNRSRQLAF